IVPSVQRFIAGLSVISSTFLLHVHSAFSANLPLKPGQTVLLLDRSTVASATNLRQQFFPAKKYSGNPVLRRTEPWEGVGPYIWGTRLMQDAASKELRLWYTAYSFQGNAYRW